MGDVTAKASRQSSRVTRSREEVICVFGVLA
jgi:hypothetical protein